MKQNLASSSSSSSFGLLKSPFVALVCFGKRRKREEARIFDKHQAQNTQRARENFLSSCSFKILSLARAFASSKGKRWHWISKQTSRGVIRRDLGFFWLPPALRRAKKCRHRAMRGSIRRIQFSAKQGWRADYFVARLSDAAAQKARKSAPLSSGRSFSLTLAEVSIRGARPGRQTARWLFSAVGAFSLAQILS